VSGGALPTHALRQTKRLRIRHEPHIRRNIIIAHLLRPQYRRHCARTIPNQNTIPAPTIRVRQRAQQTLIRVHAREQQRLLPAFPQVSMEGEIGGPKTGHARFVEADVGGGDVGEEIVVDVGVPGTLEQAAFAALFCGEGGAETDVPAVAFLVREGFVEAAGDGRWHDFEVVVCDAPVQPRDVDLFCPTFLDDFEEGCEGLDALGVVAEERVDEEVLHVDYDQQRLLRIEHHAAVIANPVIGVDGQFAGAAAGEIEAAGGRVVEPLVVAACEGTC
jgi:hypothetical protein